MAPSLRSLAVFLLVLVISARLSAREAEGHNFGVVEGFWLPEAVCELGAGWERIIFDWAQHQPSGPDDWNTLNVDDRWLAAAHDCNREVVAIIKHTPAWATEGTPGVGVPDGLYLPVDDEGNLWARFLKRTAAYYAPRGVHRFIVWNEPDINRETYGFEFEGTLDDYFQMLKVAYLALREGNPQARVHLAGMTYWHDVNAGRRLYLDRLLERIQQDPEAASNQYYFDVASLHVYFRTSTVYDIIRQTRDLLNRYGLTDKNIWVNEMNAAPTDDPLWPVVRPVYRLDLGQQAAFLVQAAALSLAAGAERVAVYKFYDWNLPPGGEAFGLLRADQSRRPAFDAWAAVIQLFSNVSRAVVARTDHLTVVRLVHQDGHETLVMWSMVGSAVSVELSPGDGPTTVYDQYGRVAAVTSADEVMSLNLPGARCTAVDGCAVGGDVTIVVRRDADGGTSIFERDSGKRIELQFMN